MDKWFDVHTKYISDLELQFGSASRTASALARKHAELEQVCLDMGGASAGVASTESTLDKSSADSFSRLADIYTPMAGLFKQAANDETNQFEEQLKDYVRYMAAVKVRSALLSLEILKLCSCRRYFGTDSSSCCSINPPLARCATSARRRRPPRAPHSLSSRRRSLTYSCPSSSLTNNLAGGKGRDAAEGRV